MQKLSVSLEVDHVEMLESRPEDSRSEALRSVLDEYENLGAECEDLRTECERLRNEKRTLLEQREEHGELVEYVDREKRYRDAGLGKRVKWWVFGMSSGES